MANQIQPPTLDAVFLSLADPTRRAVIETLGQGEASVSTLADPHDMALPSFLKHLRKLEAAGIVQSRKDGRIRICSLHPEALAGVEDWLTQQRNLWEGRLDRLEALLQRLPPDQDP